MCSVARQSIESCQGWIVLKRSQKDRGRYRLQRLFWPMRRDIALERGAAGWCKTTSAGRVTVWPATSEEAKQAVADWNVRGVTRQLDPRSKLTGGYPLAGELRAATCRRRLVAPGCFYDRACAGYAPTISAHLALRTLPCNERRAGSNQSA